MTNAALAQDVYEAIAEPNRRAILELLSETERPVGEVVDELGIRQPSVSKHLRVLREVDLVSVRKDGRRRLYTAKPEALEPVHEWVAQFERFWGHQLDSIAKRAERDRREG
ncbi:MAG: metalloregulator ArsR/SmtB family transcription factor [Gemmatimonadota bacterium]|nr:metalloregulator ArsR/SmtB family transcription factor [Gemmatimonadota bacterium]